MKILILYFSGTGNTHFIGEKVREELDKRNIEVNLSSIEKFQLQNVKNFDILILGYPIYGYDMPIFMQDYVKDIAIPRRKKVIIFSTMGANCGNASRKVGKRLIKLGMTPLHFEEIIMPGSDALVFKEKDSEYVSEILSINYRKDQSITKAINNIVKVINNELISNKSKEDRNIPSMKYRALPLEVLISIGYKFIEKKIIKKFWANDKCINCHLCEENCPSHNIVVNNRKVSFSNKCYLCMRCINQCPAEAIQIGKKTVGKFRWKGPGGNYKPIKEVSKVYYKELNKNV